MPEIIQPTDFPGFTSTPASKVTEEDGEVQEGLRTEVIDPEDTGTDAATNVIDPNEVIEETPESPDDADDTTEEVEKPDDSGETPTETSEDFDAKAYFEMATALGVLEVPEDFKFDDKDPEKSVLEAIKYTDSRKYSQAESAYLQAIEDAGLVELIEYGLQGGKFADLGQYFNSVQQETDYTNLDLSSEENQIKVYKEYLNSTGRFSDTRVNQMIDLLQEDDELGKEAQKAKDYFIQEAQKEKEKLAAESAARRQAEEATMKRRQTEFLETLGSSGYSKTEQQRILNSFATVEVDEGVTARAFEKTLMDIQNNPEHFIDFIVMLNNYDAKKGFSFDNVQREAETKATKTVLEKFKEATTHLGKGTRGSIDDKPIVPRENPYVKNIQYR